MFMQIVAWLASLFVFLSFFMKTMVPLRIMAIVSNLAFIAYALLGLQEGVFDKVAAIFALHCALLPLNILRLYQMKSLIRRVREAAHGEAGIEHLIPYMKKREYAAGDVLMNKGDRADSICFIQSGRVSLPELGKELGAGAVFGEVGIFSRDHVRAATVVCDTDCTVYQISQDRVLELYYQAPQFGFYLMRSVAQIVNENTELLANRGVRSEQDENPQSDP